MRRIFITSILLLTIGALGLVLVLAIEGWGASLSNFGAGRGYGFRQEDRGHMSRGPWREPKQDFSFEQVGEKAEDYLERNDLRELEITEIMEFTRNFYIVVGEPQTQFEAMELLVDKSTGSIFPEYGPNMMWNLKYGSHPRIPLSQTSLDMEVDVEDALRLAGRYLARSGIGETVEDDVKIFYGYYTIHTYAEDGDIAGMLSVNGYTGEVWYHHWHGLFVAMQEDH